MPGHGFYNKHSHEQAKPNTHRLPLIADVISRNNSAQIGSEFRIPEYGSAQWQNSLLPMKIGIAELKTVAAKAGTIEISITVAHTDLPTNGSTPTNRFVLAKTAIRAGTRSKKYSCRSSSI